LVLVEEDEEDEGEEEEERALSTQASSILGEEGVACSTGGCSKSSWSVFVPSVWCFVTRFTRSSTAAWVG
jgi:hypothetical protein